MIAVWTLAHIAPRRMNTAKDYLIEQGIVSSRTETVGRGESAPVASCSEISGNNNRTNTNLVDCLKANRRVVVEIKTLTLAQQ